MHNLAGCLAGLLLLASTASLGEAQASPEAVSGLQALDSSLRL